MRCLRQQPGRFKEGMHRRQNLSWFSLLPLHLFFFFFFGIDLEKKEELRIHLEKTLLKD